MIDLAGAYGWSRNDVLEMPAMAVLHCMDVVAKKTVVDLLAHHQAVLMAIVSVFGGDTAHEHVQQWIDGMHDSVGLPPPSGLVPTYDVDDLPSDVRARVEEIERLAKTRRRRR